MSWLLAAHMRTIASVQNLGTGESDSVFEVGGAKLGVRICYESIFPDLTRRLIEAGADILVNITNDAWYGKAGAEQALAMTAMRAVETKKSVIRVANQGLTAIISPAGKIQISSPFAAPAGVVRDVSWTSGKTAYVRFGDVFARSCVALTAAGLLLAALLRLKTRQRRTLPVKGSTAP